MQPVEKKQHHGLEIKTKEKMIINFVHIMRFD